MLYYMPHFSSYHSIL